VRVEDVRSFRGVSAEGAVSWPKQRDAANENTRDRVRGHDRGKPRR